MSKPATGPHSDDRSELIPAVRHFTVPASWLYDGDCRLDAQTYAGGSLQVSHVLASSGLALDSIGSVCGTMWHPVQNQARSNFKRIYTEPEHGTPFLSSRSMFGFPLTPSKFLSNRMEKLRDLMVPEGWLVVSRSGTVGNILYVNKSLARHAISDHAIRVEPTKVPAGYLYSFLASKLGQTLLAKSVFGATVDELEPKHIAAIKLPRLGLLENEIHDLVVRAYALRDSANEALANVADRLYEILGVAPFSDDDVEYLARRPGGPRVFEGQPTTLTDRLDATHHVPVVPSAVKKLGDGKHPLARLGDRVSRVYVAPRFARIYVNQEHGVPFLQGSQMPLIRPYRLQHISRTQTKDLDRWIIRSGWVLVTCSGTIGRVAVSTTGQDGWAASQHILRIVPDRDLYHPGFLWAFLSTGYGQHQLKARIYGGVVDELTEDDTKSVLIPEVPVHHQADIGETVLNAYQARDDAQDLEDRAIGLLEEAVGRSTDVTAEPGDLR